MKLELYVLVEVICDSLIVSAIANQDSHIEIIFVKFVFCVVYWKVPIVSGIGDCRVVEGEYVNALGYEVDYEEGFDKERKDSPKVSLISGIALVVESNGVAKVILILNKVLESLHNVNSYINYLLIS